MLETKQHPIDGFVYVITQLGAKKGRTVLAHVMRVVAGAAEAEAPVARIAAGLTDAEVDYLCDTFAAVTMVAKAETPDAQVKLSDVFDMHFANRYGPMLKWLWAALETNYSSFLSDMGLNAEALAGVAKTAKEAMSGALTPASPTPRSGASSSPASVV